MLVSVLLKSDFWVSVVSSFVRKRGFDAVSVLAYTSLLSLIPLLAVVVSLLSSVPLFQNASILAMNQILAFIVPSVGSDVVLYLKKFTLQATHLKGVGLGILFITVLLLLRTIDEKINLVMSDKYHRHWKLSLLQYLGITLIGPLFIGAGVLLSTYLSALPLLTKFLDQASWVSLISISVLSIVPIILNGLGFALLYKTIPYGKIYWRVALFGGGLTAVCILILQKGFGLYLAWFPTYNVIYGAFAVIPIFLVWLYLIWWVILFNGAVTKKLQDRLSPRDV